MSYQKLTLIFLDKYFSYKMSSLPGSLYFSKPFRRLYFPLSSQQLLQCLQRKGLLDIVFIDRSISLSLLFYESLRELQQASQHQQSARPGVDMGLLTSSLVPTHRSSWSLGPQLRVQTLSPKELLCFRSSLRVDSGSVMVMEEGCKHPAPDSGVRRGSRQG